MYIFYSIVLILISLLIYKVIKSYKFRQELSKIPCPSSVPFLGNMLHIILSTPEQTFQRFRDYSSRFYPIYKLTSPFMVAVSLLDPNDIEQVLSSSKHISKSRIYTFLERWLGTGLLTSTGSKWQNRRKILTPAFHFSILQEFITIFHDETAKLVDELAKECDNPSTNLMPYITQFTLQSIGETAMGFTLVDKSSQIEYKNAIYKIPKIIYKRISRPWLVSQTIFNLSALGREEMSLIKILHDFSNKIIHEKEKELDNIVSNEEKNTNSSYSKRKRLAMLDLLLAAKKNGADIDHDGIREEVDTFMFEGHDTTSIAISFILIVLACHGNVQDKVFEEIFNLLGPDRLPTFDDFKELKYTERCIKETLRLFPSVPFIARIAAEDFRTTTGYPVLKDAIIHLHIFDVHRNPKIYPDPLTFDPDRFLPENTVDRHPFAYIPFSAGPRNCIGQRFAMLELKAVLCGLLRTFRFQPISQMLDIRFALDLVLRPIDDIKVKISPRIINKTI